MTPERKKWWDSLPQGERELREAITKHEKWIKINKSYLLLDGTTDIEYLKKLLRRQKLIVKALKHELERGGHTTIGSVQTGFNTVWGCTSCNTIIFVGSMGGHSYRYCPYCGRKIKELE